MKKIQKYFIIILIISFFVMFFSFKAQSKQIIATFSNIKYSWFILSVTLITLAHLLDAYFIIYYCRRINKKYSVWQGIKVQQVGTFLNLITPASSGGQFGQIALLSQQGIKTKQSASMLMLNFISWQIVLVSFSSIALIFNYSHLAVNYSGFIISVFLGFAIDLAVIFGLFLSIFSRKFHQSIFLYIIPFLGKVKIIKNVEEKKQSTKEWITLFKKEFTFLLSHNNILFRRLLIDITKIIILFSTSFLCALSLGAPIGIEDYLTLLVLSCFAQMITTLIPTPGSSGGTEGIFILIFSPILGAFTTSVMLLWRLVAYFIPMFISFLVFANISEISDSIDKKSLN